MTGRRTARHQQHGWDALRSQLLARFERAGQALCAAVTPEVGRPFRLDDAEPYYGPTRGAREAINGLLGLEAGAGQAEWERQAADPARIEALVDELGNAALDVETRSAIVLLSLGFAEGMSTELLARLRWHLRRDSVVQARMRYWWTHMDGGRVVMEALS